MEACRSHLTGKCKIRTETELSRAPRTPWKQTLQQAPPHPTPVVQRMGRNGLKRLNYLVVRLTSQNEKCQNVKSRKIYFSRFHF